MGLSIVGGVLAFQIFSAATKSQATPQQTMATKPVDGNINKEVVDNLIQRTVISESSFRLLEPVAQMQPITPTPIPTQEQTATGAAATIATRAATIR